MGKKFMMQVNNTFDIAESKYGHDKLIIVYVLTRAVATKSLTRKHSFLDNILVKDCGPCRVHGNSMGRKPQAMVHPNYGSAKRSTQKRLELTTRRRCLQMMMILCMRRQILSIVLKAVCIAVDMLRCSSTYLIYTN